MDNNEKFIILSDGTIYDGIGFGSDKEVLGEIVFNTSMTGYQEMLTDPSYRGQILVSTYPMIGNYGIDNNFSESKRIQVKISKLYSIGKKSIFYENLKNSYSPKN